MRWRRLGAAVTVSGVALSVERAYNLGDWVEIEMHSRPGGGHDRDHVGEPQCGGGSRGGIGDVHAERRNPLDQDRDSAVLLSGTHRDANCLRSREMLLSIFSFQNAVFDFGSVNFPQPCACQKQPCTRISFFLLGKMIEFDRTEKIFTKPSDKRTEDYITGRFG